MTDIEGLDALELLDILYPNAASASASVRHRAEDCRSDSGFSIGPELDAVLNAPFERHEPAPPGADRLPNKGEGEDASSVLSLDLDLDLDADADVDVDWERLGLDGSFLGADEKSAARANEGAPTARTPTANGKRPRPAPAPAPASPPLYFRDSDADPDLDLDLDLDLDSASESGAPLIITDADIESIITARPDPSHEDNQRKAKRPRLADPVAATESAAGPAAEKQTAEKRAEGASPGVDANADADASTKAKGKSRSIAKRDPTLACGYSQAIPHTKPKSTEEAHLGFNNIVRPVEDEGKFVYPEWRYTPGRPKIQQLMRDEDQEDRIRGLIRSQADCVALKIAEDAALNGNPWMARRAFMAKYKLLPNANKSTRKKYNITGKAIVFQDVRMFGNARTPFVSKARPQVVDFRKSRMDSQGWPVDSIAVVDECRANPVWVREWLRHHPLTVDISVALRDLKN